MSELCEKIGKKIADIEGGAIYEWLPEESEVFEE